MTPQTSALEKIIGAAWDDRASLSPETKGEYRDAVETAIMSLDSGDMRVAEKNGNNDWVVHQWLKKAVLLGFRLHANGIMSGGPNAGNWWDKVPSKFEGWGEEEFSKAGFRAVPNCAARRGSFIAPNVVLMPSYVNIGAYSRIMRANWKKLSPLRRCWDWRCPRTPSSQPDDYRR